MRVLMMPDYRPDNPYQQLLAQGLLEQDGHVEFPNGYRRVFPITRACLDHAPVDVLHLHWPGPYLKGQTWAVKAVYAAKLLVDLFCVRQQGIRIVWTVHNKVSHDTNVPELQRWIRRGVARLADRLIVHDEATRREVAKTYRIPAAKIHVIPHGHYRDVYGDSVPKAEAREALDVPQMGRVFLNFGMLRPYKGIETLLDVWPVYQRDHPADTLLIAGKPADLEYEEALRSQVQACPNAILEARFIPDEDVHLYFSAADAVVLPFRQITTSGSMLLAMSYDTPIIAPRVPSLERTLQPATDLLYEEGDLLSMLRKSQHINLEGLAQKTKEACDRLSWGWISGQTWEAYAEAAQQELDSV
jgi:glycosyltransferase involved in cell wall biosynthesis